MKVSEYQQWLYEYDSARGFDRVQPSQTLVHAMEEMGEIAREVLYLEGYREDENAEERRALLAGELADCVTFLFKLAYQFDIDMEEALKANQPKAYERFPVEQGRELTERYLERQKQNAKHRGQTSEIP